MKTKSRHPKTQARKHVSVTTERACDCNICAIHDWHVHSRRGIELPITQQIFAWTRLMLMSPDTEELYSLRSYLQDSRRAKKTEAAS